MRSRRHGAGYVDADRAGLKRHMTETTIKGVAAAPR